MMEIIRKHFTMYTDCETEEEQWQSTQDIVDLCMKVLLVLTLIAWGI